jgi:hypothetical protein
VLKVILETALLTDEERDTAVHICRIAGVTFVKTSTGFSKGGATSADVAAMAAGAAGKMGVKASGGIRTLMDAVLMISSGATRIGASKGVGIMKEAEVLHDTDAEAAREHLARHGVSISLHRSTEEEVLEEAPKRSVSSPEEGAAAFTGDESSASFIESTEGYGAVNDSPKNLTLEKLRKKEDDLVRRFYKQSFVRAEEEEDEEEDDDY